MIIDTEVKKHRVLSAVECSIKRCKKQIEKGSHVQVYQESYENLLAAVQRDAILKEKTAQKREELLEKTLSSIIDDVRNNPEMLDEIAIQLEINPNFMNCGSSDADYKKSEVRSMKHNFPPDPHQEEIFQQDLEKRCQQRQQCCQSRQIDRQMDKQIRPQLVKLLEESDEELRTSRVIDNCIEKITKRK